MWFSNTIKIYVYIYIKYNIPIYISSLIKFIKVTRKKIQAQMKMALSEQRVDPEINHPEAHALVCSETGPDSTWTEEPQQLKTHSLRLKNLYPLQKTFCGDVIVSATSWTEPQIPPLLIQHLPLQNNLRQRKYIMLYLPSANN